MEAPEYFRGGFCSQFTSSDAKTDHFIVEDLLDFPHDDDALITDPAFDSLPTDSSILINSVDTSNSSSFSGCDPNFNPHISSRNLPDPYFSSDLCVPSDDMAELEWLSNIGEESFSSEDLQKLELISGIKARNEEASESRELQHPEETNRNNVMLNRQVSVPAKARSKRSRGPPCNWTSRLLALSPTSSSSEPDIVLPTQPGKSVTRRKENGDEGSGEGRKCLHCATDKTPQWRTGPMGPKTLCNACGVRYKSGRLVPEYRPAASPTFVLTKHSNSHRKVLELRRQKEMMRAQQQQQQRFLQHQNMMFDVSNGDDYLIHQDVGPDIRQLI
ncbi:GATA transcription factor 12-like [Neltuma alba]|uniref:GATA transcription factor 12-like n=1 Tax=Neltuma alba TaxID=207710 RepID=UPI0010A5942E|nr:GATA transcription factor 12-like [Prosopis alba]